MSVASVRGRSATGRRHRLALAALVAVVCLVAVPLDPAAGREPSSTRVAGGTEPGGAPSQMYVDAMAHAADRISFEPGARVTVPFRPRASDRWTVDGGPPRALPAGRLSGREMAGMPAEDAARPAASTDPVTAPDAGAGQTAGPSPSPDQSPSPDPSPTLAPAETPAPSPAPEAPPPPVDAPTGGIPIAAETAAFRFVPAAQQPDPALPAGLRREVYGFLPYWEVGASSTRLDYSVLSHIAFFSVGADASGNLLKRDADGSLTTGWGGWTSQRMTDVINGAHARGSRVTLTISVFAWTSGQLTRQKALLGSATARANLARQAVAAVRDRGADGINLDFEPLASGYEDEFTALVRAIRAEFGRYNRGYHLTFDTMGSPGNYPLEAALASGGADAVFIMGYDYRTASANYAGSIDPLAGPAYDLADTVDRYLARVPASRVILGIPYYGRAWSTVSDARNARTQTGAKYGYSITVSYENAVELAADYGRRWDSREMSAWIAYRRQNCTSTYGCVTSWRQVYYDDATSLKLRYDLINRSGLRGAGIWALGYDGSRPELYRALADKFLRDTTPPRAGIRILPASVGDEGFVVRWRAVDDWSGVASYDVQVAVAGGAWQTWKSATSATDDVWLGKDGVGYAFRVRARDTKGNLSAWKVTSVFESSPSLRVGGFARPAVADVAMRTAPDTSASVEATVDPAHIVAIVGGPVVADGLTWYEVVGPLYDWAPVGTVRTNVWMAAASGGTTLLTPVRAPNTTLVAAVLRGFSFGSGGAASLGAGGAAQRAFSPNGDGSRDRLGLLWTNRRGLDTLELRVLATSGTLLGSTPLPDVAAGEQTHAWDGRAGGAVLADGRYLLQLVATSGSAEYHAPSVRPDTAAQVAAYAVTIDTVPPTVASAALSSTRLSPNGDGRFERVTVGGSGSSDAVRWELTATPAGSTTPVRRIAGSGRSASTAWDGRTDGGTRVPDGAYTLALGFLDAAGNRASRSWTVRVDTTPASLALAATPTTFAPGAGTTRLAWTASERVDGWLRLMRGSTLVRRWPVSGSAGAVTWDGRDAAGRSVADGRVSLQLQVRDWFGNASSRSTWVYLDRTLRSFGASPSAFFPQDGDALARTTALTAVTAGSATLTLRIVDATGAEVRRAWTSRAVGAGTHTWRWDGKVAGGAWAPRGAYTAVLTAASSSGSVEARRSITADAFTMRLSTATAGRTFAVIFRSSEPLRERPRATIRAGSTGTALPLAVVARSDGSWRATVTLPSAWRGPTTVTISGRDTGGQTNSATADVTIE